LLYELDLSRDVSELVEGGLDKAEMVDFFLQVLDLLTGFKTDFFFVLCQRLRVYSFVEVWVRWSRCCVRFSRRWRRIPTAKAMIPSGSGCVERWMRSRSRLSSTSKSSIIVSSMRAVVSSIKGDLGVVVFEDILEKEVVLLKEEDSVLEKGNEFWFFLT
jgi:hypothetical protein